jgi:hypothetical protein
MRSLIIKTLIIAFLISCLNCFENLKFSNDFDAEELTIFTPKRFKHKNKISRSRSTGRSNPN